MNINAVTVITRRQYGGRTLNQCSVQDVRLHRRRNSTPTIIFSADFCHGRLRTTCLKTANGHVVLTPCSLWYTVCYEQFKSFLFSLISMLYKVDCESEGRDHQFELISVHDISKSICHRIYDFEYTT